MGADQIAEIRPAIAELEVLPEDEQPDVVAEFQVAGREDLWVQVILGTVNFSYPFMEDPIKRISDAGIGIPLGTVLEDWEPGNFATLGYLHEDSRKTASFVDELFEKLLGAEPGYAVDVAIQRLR